MTTNPLRMVIEFCPLGDLNKHLMSELILPNEIFTNKLRAKFAFDISCGMTYLSTHNPIIIHRDLRSPNVSFFFFLFSNFYLFLFIFILFYFFYFYLF